jgi:hypothetical protein
MFLLNRKFLVIVGIVLIVAAPSLSRTRRNSKLSAGNWGGMHIVIAVEQDAATVAYDCANGTITGPLTIDSRGRFSWRGNFTREGPGPVREDRPPKGLPAIYSGSVKSDTMTLTVKLADTKSVLGTFTLKRGNPGRVFKCK